MHYADNNINFNDFKHLKLYVYYIKKHFKMNSVSKPRYACSLHNHFKIFTVINVVKNRHNNSNNNLKKTQQIIKRDISCTENIRVDYNVMLNNIWINKRLIILW